MRLGVRKPLECTSNHEIRNDDNFGLMNTVQIQEEVCRMELAMGVRIGDSTSNSSWHACSSTRSRSATAHEHTLIGRAIALVGRTIALAALAVS